MRTTPTGAVVRLVLAWAAALVMAGAAFVLAWTGYDEPGRPERTVGHIYIDFAGQWVMGRMLARGEGRRLYDWPRLREVLREAYGPADGDNVANHLIIADQDRGVGGSLYPPIHAFVCYPLGLLPPLPAYRLTETANLLLTFVIGFLVWRLTHGRVWPAVAAAVVVVFPGYNGALSLGQNSLASLALLLLGWLLVARNRPWLGGVVWGLLAFKPVWAAAFFLVPLLSRRWRVCSAMLLTGLALALLTLPFVGLQTWLDWLAVGRAASTGYTTFENWVFLSRDLQDVPRRWLLTFADGFVVETDQTLPTLLGLALWLTVLTLTVLLALVRRRRPAGTEGPPAAFLMLGAFLGCFHFMYYDVLLAGLPVCLLFTDPARYLKLAHARPPGWLWGAAPVALTALLILLPHAANAVDYLAHGGHAVFHSPPFDTFCLLALWAWCGRQWFRQGEGGR